MKPKRGGLQGSNDEEASLAGKKRLSNTAGKNPMQRKGSIQMSSKRAADQVMAMGLAPERGQTDSPADARAQARLRAESKFTFKPDDLSDE